MDKAFEDLKRYRLAKAEWCLLPLLGAAVASGATRAQVTTDSTGTSFDFDGSVLTVKEADNLFLKAFKQPGKERELAVGLYMLAQNESGSLSYEGWDGSTGVRLRVDAGKLKTEKLTKNPFKEAGPLNRVKMLAKKGWRPFGGLFGSGKAEEASPEIVALEERGRYAPLELEINGQKANRPLNLGRSLVALIVEAESGEPGVKLQVASQDTLDQLTIKGESSFSAVLATGGEGTRELGTLSILYYGVLYSVDAPSLTALGVRGVVASTIAQPSADRVEIEDSKAFKELLKELEGQSLKLAELLADQLADMNSIDRVEATDQLKHLCQCLMEKNETELVEKLYTKLLEAQEDILGDDDPELAPTLLTLTSLREQLGRWEECIPAYERVLEIYATSKPDPSLIAAAQAGLAQLYLTGENLEKAEECCRAALDLRKSCLASDDIDLGTNYELMARVYQLRYKYPQRKFVEVDGLYLNALKIFEKNFGTHHPDIAVLLSDLAEHRRQLRRYKEAEPLLKRALKIRIDNFGERDSIVAQTLDSYGSLYEEQGKSALAGDFYSRALAIWEDLLGPEHPDVAERLNNLVVLYRLYGRFHEAEPLYQRMLDIHDNEDQQLDLVSDLTNLALLYQVQAKFEDAEPLLVRALQLLQDSYGHDAEQAWVLNHMGDLLDYQGRFDNAESILMRSLGIWESLLGPEHFDLTVVLDALARHHRMNNKFDKGQEFARRSLALKEKHVGELHPESVSGLATVAELVRLSGDETLSRQLHHEVILRRKKYSLAEENEAPSASDISMEELQESRYSAAKMEAGEYLRMAAQPAKVYSRYPEAEHLYLRAIFAREQAVGPNHPDISYALDALASLYKIHRKMEGAETLYQRTLRLRKISLGPNHPDVCLSLSNLIDIYCQQKRYSQAEPLAQEWLQIVNTTLGEEHPEAGRVLEKLSEIYGASGNVDRQEECNRRALELRQKVLGVEHPDFATSLADLLVLQQKFDEAAKLYGFVAQCLEDALGQEHPDLIPVYEKYANVLRKLNKETLAVEYETQVMVMRVTHGLDFGDE